MSRTTITRIYNRHDTAENWEAKNPILGVGEIGYDTTNKITKIGDGITPWDELEELVTKIGGTFATMSWSQIAKISESGQASLYFRVGDRKTIELSTGEEFDVVILGFYHDKLSEGSGYAGMTIGMENVLSTDYKMNNGSSNTGGWNECVMRTNTLPTIFSQLPSDLQAVIKTVNKKATAGNRSTDIVVSQDQLFLLSRAEMITQTEEGYIDEGTKYEYWETVKDGETAAERIKYKPNGSANSYWLRSPATGSSLNFSYIVTTGSVNNLSASNTYGVSFGFCV